ncbi:MAG: hypothetical protein AAF333_19240 [Planctomycetota bacterium]
MIAALLAQIVAAAVLANPAADLEMLRVTGGATPQVVAQILEQGVASLREAGEAQRTDAQRCADAFVAGEWHRAAARLVPDAGYTEEALQRFRAMRLDYPGQATSWLGYVGEARVYRQTGQLDEAAAVLEVVIDPQAAVPEAIRRVAELDRLEIELRRDPAAALVEAESHGKAAAWIEARALAALGRHEAAADAARRPAAVASAPAYDRLKLLADSGHATEAEWSAWVELLFALEMADAALDTLDTRTPKAFRGLHAQLLYDAGRRVEAADRWEQVLADTPDDDPARWFLAVSLTQAVADDPTLIPRAKAALRGAAGRESMDTARRLDALRWWAGWSTPEEVSEILAEYRALIAEDAGLRYRYLSARLALRLPPADAVEQLLAIERDAADNEALRAAAVLTRAQHGSGEPRKALSVLDEHRALLAAQPHTAAAAGRLRVRLWVAAGLLEPALDAVLASPAGYDPGVLLTLAAALVEREAGRAVDEPFPEVGRSRVTRLVNLALVQRPDDDSLTLRGAQLMMDAEAWSDAARVLHGVSPPVARLSRARALLQMGRTDEAWAALDDIDTPEASVLRAGWLIEDDQLEPAIAEARAARAASRPGSDTWWQATCELVAAQARSGQTAAAADVLRVAEVLHPLGERRDLRRRVESLRKEITP